MFSLADSDGRDFLVWTDPAVMDDDMRNLARAYIDDQADTVIDDGEEGELAIRSKFNALWGMTYIWKNVKDKKYGLLLKENLVKMEKVERMVNTSAEWKEYCVA